MTGGAPRPKIKVLFIGTIPCDMPPPKDSSWWIYEQGDYEKYNKHHNEYGIREKRTIGVGFTFPFARLFIEKWYPKTDAWFVLSKEWASKFKIHDAYKNKIINADLSDYGKNLTDEQRKQLKDFDIVYIDMRTVEFLLPEKEIRKYMVKDPVLNETVYTKSYEDKLIPLFSKFVKLYGYIISDECSGLIPYRKLNGELHSKNRFIDIHDSRDIIQILNFPEIKQVVIDKNGIPKRDYVFEKIFNENKS